MGRNMRAVALIMAVGLSAAGCEQRPAGRPVTVPVNGVVRYDGEVVAGATVSFQADAGGRSASGISDALGRYQLSTFSRGDGAVPGSYKVIVLKYAPATESSGDPGTYVPPQGPEPPPKHLLPEKYAAVTTSGLEATVSSGPNTIDFDLAR
jgi:hypothetical protein